MSAGRWVILISLLLVLLLVGAFLLHPLVRFTACLYFERFDAAASVYRSGSEGLREAAQGQLRLYLEEKQEKYLARELSYDQVMALLSPLGGTDLPQEDIDAAIQAVEKMEQARTDLARADGYAANGNYAEAIPLYRQSLMADEGAAYRLTQAETAYKNDLLRSAEAAMDEGRYEEAKRLLLDGEALLGDDEDIELALSDVDRMQADEAYAATVQQALDLLRDEGPDAAFAFAADLRRAAPDEYGYEYLEQLVRHRYEEDLCAQAEALGAADPAGAVALLDEGLSRLDSERMRQLLSEIRSAMVYWLTDLPVLRDETGNGRTGAQSTLMRDGVLTDSQGDPYTHSLWADLGSLTFSLDGGFDAFTGTVAFPQGQQADLYRASATLQIYGDGVLLAEFKDMDGESAPLPFSLPVTGVGELTLRWTSEGANGWKDWGIFATVFDGRLIPAGGLS